MYDPTMDVTCPSIAIVDSQWLDNDYITITLALSRGQFEELVNSAEDEEVLKTLLAESVFASIKNATTA